MADGSGSMTLIELDEWIKSMGIDDLSFADVQVCLHAHRTCLCRGRATVCALPRNECDIPWQLRRIIMASAHGRIQGARAARRCRHVNSLESFLRWRPCRVLSLFSLSDHTKKNPCALRPAIVLLPCANSFWVAPLIPTTAASWRWRSSCKICVCLTE